MLTSALAALLPALRGAARLPCAGELRLRDALLLLPPEPLATVGVTGSSPSSRIVCVQECVLSGVQPVRYA